MKKLFIIFLIFSNYLYSQSTGSSSRFMTFPKHTNAASGLDLQLGMFLDAFGKPPQGGNGRHKGLTFTALMDFGWIELSASNFSQLQDGYTDFVFSGGVNFHLLEYKPIRYYAGVRLSPWVYRAARHELVGGIIGFDWCLNNNSKRTKYYLGGRLFADHAEDLEDGRGYRHSSYYDGGVIFKKSTIRENGAFVFSMRPPW